MAVYLSPGVFAVETDKSEIPINSSPLIPAFIGTANKGPIDTPTFVTSAEQYIDTFGEPFPESYLGYAVLGYFSEGNAAWIVRVGIECDDGQTSALADICIDTSGNKIGGWGRLPLFSGIDYGRIHLRIPTTGSPIVFHIASVDNISYHDAEVSSTFGPAQSTMTFTGSGLSDDYVDPIDDSFILLITGDPDASAAADIAGATYQITRNSDGVVISTGTLAEATSSTSTPIAIGSGDDDTGLIGRITLSAGAPLGVGDTFTFQAHPDNRFFTISVEGATAYAYQFEDGDSYDTAADFETAFNAIITGTSEDYICVSDSEEVLDVRTIVAGNRIQVTGTEAWALEVGISKWVYDIPRSHFQATDQGTFLINSNNDRASIEVISALVRTQLDITIPVGTAITTETIATTLHAGGISGGTRYFVAISLQVTDDDTFVTVITTDENQFDQVKLLADFSHSETIRFANVLGVHYPYTNVYRGYSDIRVSLPTAGVVTSATPLSCEEDPDSAQCASDSAYFQNIVGFLVATSPGTWLTDWTITLSNFINTPGSYELSIYDDNGIHVDRIQNFTFDPRDDNYIANILNPGTSIGGSAGNKHLNWEERPAFLDNDSTVDGFVPRQPSLFNRSILSGMANGIPTDATYSADLDSAIIGNPATGSGLNGLTNTDRYDISLLCIPGSSSGAIIAAGLQFCESRGDCVFLVDPPFGLRPQQIVDWHNGILFSDLANSLNSSYGALYWGWLNVFDQFNKIEIFVPPSGHVASVFARTARVAETWFAPAGLNRGRLLTALDIEYNPTQGERDLLYGYNNAVNPITNFSQDGIVIWGQRTLQRKDSALDRVNVRMLLIAIKKTLRVLLRQFIFEPNDKFLRAQIKNITSTFLGGVAARRGLTAYSVICDETNNTPQRIDANEIHLAVLVKPTRAAEFAVLDIAVLRTDQSFSAEESLQAAGVVG